MEIGKPRRTHTVEPLEDPAPRERPEESPELKSRPSLRASRRRYRRKGAVSWQRPDYVEPIVGWRGWFVGAVPDVSWHLMEAGGAARRTTSGRRWRRAVRLRPC